MPALTPGGRRVRGRRGGGGGGNGGPGGIGGLGLDTRIPLLLVKTVEHVRIPAGA